MTNDQRGQTSLVRMAETLALPRLNGSLRCLAKGAAVMIATDGGRPRF